MIPMGMNEGVAYPEIRVPLYRDEDHATAAAQGRYLRLLAASVAGRVPESLVRSIAAIVMSCYTPGEARYELGQWFTLDPDMADHTLPDEAFVRPESDHATTKAGQITP